MGHFVSVKKETIENVFIREKRQYFVGDLKQPQKLPFFMSPNIEIGLTSYDDYAIEPAHRHSLVIEYMYMLSGKTKYIDLDNNEIDRGLIHHHVY